VRTRHIVSERVDVGTVGNGVSMAVGDCNIAAVQVTTDGTGACSFAIEASIDGEEWVPAVTTYDGSQAGASVAITANSSKLIMRVCCAPFSLLRLRVSALSVAGFAQFSICAEQSIAQPSSQRIVPFADWTMIYASGTAYKNDYPVAYSDRFVFQCNPYAFTAGVLVVYMYASIDGLGWPSAWSIYDNSSASLSAITVGSTVDGESKIDCTCISFVRLDANIGNLSAVVKAQTVQYSPR